MLQVAPHPPGAAFIDHPPAGGADGDLQDEGDRLAVPCRAYLHIISARLATRRERHASEADRTDKMREHWVVSRLMKEGGR